LSKVRKRRVETHRNARRPASVILPLVATAILLWASDRGAQAIPLAQLPPLARLERGEYRARNARTGEELWRHQWILRRETGGGQTTVDVTQVGRGRRDGAKDASW
jgi:hypothetical protein